MNVDGRPEVGRRIADAQDRIVEHLDATRGARRARFVAAARRGKTPRSRIWIPVAGLAAAVAIVLAVLALRGEPSVEEPTVVVVAPPSVSPSELALEAGGKITIADGGVASLRELDDDTEVLLEAGSIVLDARGDSKQRVAVRAGTFRVASEDASASVRFDPEAQTLDVEVVEGTVVVISSGTSRTVVAGETVHFPRVEVVEGPKIVAPEPEPAESDEAEPRPRDGKSRKPKASWRSLAKDGKHAEAVAAAEAQGFAGILESASAVDLLELARAARYAKSTKRAKQALSAVRERFPKSGSAARAAYALGRVAFDYERDYSSAAKWFAKYLDEQPSGALAREALGRLVESQHRSGAHAAAKKSGQRYLDRYPDGPHADIARKATR